MARYSRQRELILQVIKQNLIHPNADEVYHIAKTEDPTISLGTVYRNLNFLSKHGDILKVQVSGGADRYDGNIMPHNHVICKKCGKVSDYVYDFELLKEEVLRQTGVACEHVCVAIEGVCKECFQNQNH